MVLPADNPGCGLLPQSGALVHLSSWPVLLLRSAVDLPVTWGLMLQGVANRDIKLENTLLSSTSRPVIKICDFGYSKVRPAPC